MTQRYFSIAELTLGVQKQLQPCNDAQTISPMLGSLQVKKQATQSDSQLLEPSPWARTFANMVSLYFSCKTDAWH